ncbi:MAG: nickel pincer cofactor biosynthesis protein LarB [Candidatus Sumerlaeia bacterium]
MNREALIELLTMLKRDEITLDEALARLSSMPFEDLGYAKVDHHRALRHGGAEVVFCQGKTPEHVAGIVKSLMGMGALPLATRAGQEHYEAVRALFPELVYYPAARIIGPAELADAGRGEGLVLVISAGTADLPVAEEALLTARAQGSRAEAIHDVGVAGIHRLLAEVGRLQQARVLVVVAGMEGALPSVVGGLAGRPVIAVPTSVGYGASFGGLAALLGMLNSCASNVTVVNIDNGFGAGYAASMINRLPAL